MKKLALFYAAFSIALLPGCGKKAEKAKKEEKKSVINRLFSQSEEEGAKELPLYTAEKEAVVDDEVVSDFAFVDEDEVADREKVKIATKEAESMPMEREEELLVSSDDEAVEALDFDKVQFDFNKNSIRNDQKQVVQSDIEKAKKAVSEGKDVVVGGHTCQMGSASYNLALSQKRAEAVKKEMVKAGIPADKVKTVGYGYEAPLVWSDKTEREAKIKELSPNRRAEISVK